MSVPKLRFGEFSGDWEEKKLGDIVERISRKNKNLETNLPLTISSIHGLVDQITYFNKKIASKDMSGYYLLKNGEFAYNKSYSSGYPFGSIKRLDKYENGALSSLYICFKPSTTINSDFLLSYFETSKWHKEVSVTVAEGARNHGLLNVNVTDFFATLHIFPTLPEQEKIADFLSTFDEKIENQQGIVNSLDNQKKGFMQKIFSQELRFKDENGGEFGAWEERTLGEVYSFKYGEGNTNPDNGGRYPVYGANGIIGAYSKYNAESSIIIGHMGAYAGSVLWESKKHFVTYNGTITTPIDKLKLNQKFGYYVLWKYNIRKICAGSGYAFLSYDMLNNIKSWFPTLPEQQKIADFLSTLDEKIDVEKQILDKLKSAKKGLLQQMFC